MKCAKRAIRINRQKDAKDKRIKGSKEQRNKETRKGKRKQNVYEAIEVRRAVQVTHMIKRKKQT